MVPFILPCPSPHLMPPSCLLSSTPSTLCRQVDSPPITITKNQVSRELRRLRPRKAVGPDKVCPRMLKACFGELGEPLQHDFNLSLKLGKVPVLWKTSCIIMVPKKKHPREPGDFSPEAVTSHVMKTFERLLLMSSDTMHKIHCSLDTRRRWE